MAILFTCVTEGDCLGYNKTGLRDNLGMFSGIFDNFFLDEAYHLWNYLKAAYFSYIYKSINNY
jgi:hypothetical protein